MEKVEHLELFTIDDAIEEEKICATCEYMNNCPIILCVKKLSHKRDGKTADLDFGCNIHKEDVIEADREQQSFSITDEED